MTSNNPPEVTVNLTRELAEFVVENCDSNIIFGLNTIQNGVVTSRDLIEELVANIEQFKALKEATQEALKDSL